MLVLKRMLAALSALTVIAVPTVTPTAQADVDVDEVVGDSMIYVQITFTGTVLVPGDHMKKRRRRPRKRAAPKEIEAAPATTIDTSTAPPTDTKEPPPKA